MATLAPAFRYDASVVSYHCKHTTQQVSAFHVLLHHSTAQLRTEQHSTTQHSTMQHQHSTMQHQHSAAITAQPSAACTAQHAQRSMQSTACTAHRLYSLARTAVLHASFIHSFFHFFTLSFHMCAFHRGRCIQA